MSKFRPRGFLAVLLAIIAMAAALPVLAQQSSLPDSLSLYGGQVLVYKSPKDIARVAVGNGDLVEVTTIEKRQLVVIAGAQKAGFTTLHVWYEDGSQRAISVDVNPASTSTAASVIREMLGPETAARISDIGGKVVITGELTATEAQQVGVIVKLYPDVVDLTSADPVGMQPMVLMDVRIMEFSRNRLRDLGIRWDSVIDGPTGGAIKDFTNSSFRIIREGSVFEEIADFPGTINPMQTYFGIATSIGSQIDILTQNGEAYELAAPQLSARSGGAATFLAGGEIPIPLVGGFGQTNVEFKEYGVKLDIQPVVNANGEVSTTLMTEVSRIDPSNAVGNIPGFLTRRTETELNVRAGQTIVISGLVDITGSTGFAGIPGLSAIPVLGRLFRSDNFRSGRTDLVVFVTPRVITPSSPANVDGIQRSDRMLEDFRQTIGGDIFD